MLVQRLREIQNRFGFLPDEEMRLLAQEAGVPLYRVEEVSSFFPAFRLERTNPPEIEVKVCRDMACHLRGAAALLHPKTGLAPLVAELGKQTGKRVAVEGVSCLGRCDRAPAVWIERYPLPADVHAWVYTNPSRTQLETIIRRLIAGAALPAPDADANYTPNMNPRVWSMDMYAREGWPRDYRAVKKFVDSLIAIRRRCIPRPPRDAGGKELDDYVKKSHPMLWELKTAGLLGMGGAGAPAYQKWVDVWRERSAFEEERLSDPKQPLADQKPNLFEKYIVANGDESEPGTFKDREIMLRMPHLVVEGVILAGLMTGSSAGYIYVRHEYHEQIHALREEITRATDLGACGPNVFGSGRAFPVEVFESPGGYICGEQSALLEAMEDRRSQPRNRPPELTTNGLRDRPTVVNNVETLAWAPMIAYRGGAAYAKRGWQVPGTTMGFSGRRLFSVSGDVKRPGVYEVPVGSPLRQLLEHPDFCGGVNGTLKAVATSGPSGGLLPARLPVDPKFDEKKRAEAIAKLRERSAADADMMDWFFRTQLRLGADSLNLLRLPLDINFFRNLHGALRFPVEPMLGAGLVVYAEGSNMLEQAVNFTEFYRNESCGKCVPCRLGSQKLVQIGTELLKGRTPAEEVKADIKEMTKVLQLTSICGLGYVAPIPLATALAYFPEDVGPDARRRG